MIYFLNKLKQKFGSYLLQSKFKNFYYYYLENKYKKNSDQRTLNIDWKSKNFNRIALVNFLLRNFQNPEYLEIGCASNELFDSIPFTKKVGVDPIEGGNIRKTSDDFFKENKKLFDVVFIDGLHTYEQVRKDIINSINSINGNGWVALHDMLPRNWKEQHIPMLRGPWTGDVWKVAFEIMQSKGLDFKIVSIDYGVGIIKVNNNKAILKDFRKELKDVKVNYYFDNFKKLPIVDWNEAIDWISENK